MNRTSKIRRIPIQIVTTAGFVVWRPHLTHTVHDWCGRTDTNKMMVFRHEDQRGYIIGDTVDVVIERANAATLFGRLA